MHNVFVEEVNRRNKEFQENWLREHKIVPVPKPGEKVSFPVACVTGVCFQIQVTPTSYVFRWNTGRNRLDKWDTWNPDEGKQERTFRWWPYEHACSLALFYDTVTVVEEPTTEPVWKDCNFIEAVELMKKYPAMPVARWNGDEYCLGGVSNKIRRDSDGVLIYNVAIGKELDFILGKWQIKVS